MYQRTSVGLDVHARSVVACGIDGETGEVFERRLTPQHGEILAWIRNLPAPVAVTYEAGPTGYGLARFLPENGIECVVAAPSKLQRPAGDRVKTDRRDARHLARLLHLNEIVAVTVPSVTQEAARDLVRAREATRKDLMSARHRVSKLLLRQGIVYYGGRAWTSKHELWLRAQRFDVAGRQLAYDTVFDTMLATTDRRDRLDTAIAQLAADSEYTPVGTRLGCLRGVSTLTAFALAVEIGDWHRLTGRSVGSYVGLVPASRPRADLARRGRSPRPATGTSAGCSLKRPGTTAPRIGPVSRCGAAGIRPVRRHGPGATRVTDACTRAGKRSTNATNASPSPTPRSPANSPAGAGRWPCSRTDSIVAQSPILESRDPRPPLDRGSRSVLLAALRGLHLDPGAARRPPRQGIPGMWPTARRRRLDPTTW